MYVFLCCDQNNVSSNTGFPCVTVNTSYTLQTCMTGMDRKVTYSKVKSSPYDLAGRKLK
jgi:hypothetical protein